MTVIARTQTGAVPVRETTVWDVVWSLPLLVVMAKTASTVFNWASRYARRRRIQDLMASGLFRATLLARNAAYLASRMGSMALARKNVCMASCRPAQ